MVNYSQSEWVYSLIQRKKQAAKKDFNFIQMFSPEMDMMWTQELRAKLSLCWLHKIPPTLSFSIFGFVEVFSSPSWDFLSLCACPKKMLSTSRELYMYLTRILSLAHKRAKISCPFSKDGSCYVYKATNMKPIYPEGLYCNRYRCVFCKI